MLEPESKKQTLLLFGLPALLFLVILGAILYLIGHIKCEPNDFDYAVGDVVQIKLSGQKAQVLHRICDPLGPHKYNYQVRILQPGTEYTNTRLFLFKDGPIEKNSLVKLVVADYELAPYKK